MLLANVLYQGTDAYRPSQLLYSQLFKNRLLFVVALANANYSSIEVC